MILGIKVIRRENEYILTQSHYIEKKFRKFNYFDCKPSKAPIDPQSNLIPNDGDPVDQEEHAKIIGSLMYAMNYNRPNITCAIGLLSRFTSNPSNEH